MQFIRAVIYVIGFLVVETAGAIASQFTGLGVEVTKMLIGNRPGLTYSQPLGTWQTVNTSIGLIVASVVAVALYKSRHPGSLSGLPIRVRISRWLNQPTLTNLVLGWLVAVMTVVGYPFAIYMTARFAVNRRDSSGVVAAAGASAKAPVPSEESFGTIEKVSGQGVMDMDRLFLRYLESVMQRAWDKSEAEIKEAIERHLVKLTDPDPNQAWNYRMAMVSDAAGKWPPAASHDYNLELQRHWVPSAESEERWAKWPERIRVSYMRQGRLMTGAVFNGLTADATTTVPAPTV